jgi:hypothetical protein
MPSKKPNPRLSGCVEVQAARPALTVGPGTVEKPYSVEQATAVGGRKVLKYGRRSTVPSTRRSQYRKIPGNFSDFYRRARLVVSDPVCDRMIKFAAGTMYQPVGC